MPHRSGKCIIVCAPSGAGKTTIVKHLLQTFPELCFSVSATSREARPAEADGRDYYFISADKFRKGIDSGDFLEWEEVYAGQFYGTLKKEIERIWDDKKHVIFDVDVVGGVNLKSHFGEKALSIFVRPPSLTVLEQRLRNRRTESNDQLKRRLDKASYEMTFADKFDRVLVNDDLNRAGSEAVEWVRKFLST